MENEEEIWRREYLAFVEEVSRINVELDQEIEKAKATGSPAAVLNVLSAKSFALADAIDRRYNTDCRAILIEGLSKLSSALNDELERPQSKRGQRQAAKRIRLEVIASAYERQLIASEILGRDDLPTKPGIESAYAIAGQIGCGLPHLSLDAVEQLRFRMARQAEASERGQYVWFHPETLSYSDTGGPILNLLSKLPKTRGRPRRSAPSDSK